MDSIKNRKLTDEEIDKIYGGSHIKPKNIKNYIGQELIMSYGLSLTGNYSGKCHVILMDVQDYMGSVACIVYSKTKADKEIIEKNLGNYRDVDHWGSIVLKIVYSAWSLDTGISSFVWLEPAN